MKTIHKIMGVFLMTMLFDASAQQSAIGGFSPGANTRRITDEMSEQERARRIAEFQSDSKVEKIHRNVPNALEGLSKENEGKNIQIKSIDFSPSEILPESYFRSIKEQYEGKKISVNDIFRIVNDINNTYILHGAAGAKAYLAPQDISQGKLFIPLVEGRVHKVNVSGNDHTSSEYVKDFFDMQPYSIVDLNYMQSRALEFNAANEAKARISLEPGACYGTSNVDITLKEPQRFSAAVFCDNAGQDETGLIREGIYLNARSLAGRQDLLTLGGVMSEGTYSAFGTYEIPETWFNTRIGIGFDYSKTEIVDGYLEFLNITGDYHDFYLYVKKPVWVRENTTSNVTFTLMTKDGSNYISDRLTQEAKTNEGTLAFDNIALFSQGYLFNMASFTFGESNMPARSEFYRFNYYGEYQQSIVDSLSLNLKLKGQYGHFSNGYVLPSTEQFQVGGINTVRGYREGMLIANSGIAESVELQYEFARIINMEESISSCKLFTFFDAGTIFPNSAADLPSDYAKTIYSVGGGLRTVLFGFLEAQLIYAKALKDHDYFDDTGESFLFFVKATY